MAKLGYGRGYVIWALGGTTAHSTGVSIFSLFSSSDLTVSHGRIQGRSYWLVLGLSVTGSYRGLLYLEIAWVRVIKLKFLPGHWFPK